MLNSFLMFYNYKTREYVCIIKVTFKAVFVILTI